MAEEPDGEPGVLARRLQHLFATVHPPGRGPYTIKEAVAAISEAAGRQVISSNYLWQLYTGRKDQPSHARLAAVARFFGVPVSYFSDDEAARRADEQLDLLAALRDQGVQHIAFRAAGLSPASLQAVLAVIENARRLEGLPDGEGQAPSPAAGTDTGPEQEAVRKPV